jgi:hypothetical protein
VGIDAMIRAYSPTSDLLVPLLEQVYIIDAPNNAEQVLLFDWPAWAGAESVGP